MRLRLTLLLLLVISHWSIGVAAQNYFQQDVKYTIHVSLDDKKHELNGDETIVYTNNSPDTLTQLYFHLWPNAYKDANTILAQQFFKQGDSRMLTAAQKDYGYISNVDFKVNDRQADWAQLEDSIDICVIYLKEPLAPKGTITISTPFHVKIPAGKFSRMGHVGESYQISQWYPKPAVYDRNGWNYMPYLDQGEFYSEFGTFDVFITLPQNYVLNATGDLVDGEKELKWLDEKVKETEAINPFSTDMSFPVSSDTLKTLHYHQERVHDFAWFADKRWHVLKSEITLPESKRKVTAWAMFTNDEAELWKKSIEYIIDAVKYYSQWVGEYPYNNVSAVDATISAGAGMEYPNITAIGHSGTAYLLESTISHEVGHNWFYGMLGSNERKHAWMDEGINTFYEVRYFYTKYSNDISKQIQYADTGWISRHFGLDRLNARYLLYVEYLFSARPNEDQAPDLSSEKFSALNYQADAYAKTAISFDYLKSYLGDSLFDQCMHAYFDQRKFKHPMPGDIKEVFVKTSGKNLDWMFDDLLFTTKKIDYKISGVKCFDGRCTAKVTNAGQINSPVSLTTSINGKTEATKWYDGFDGTKELEVPCSNCNEVRIDGEGKIPEINRNNNLSRTTGALKTCKSIKLQWFGSLEDHKHTQIFFTHALGWNEYNKTLLGGTIHNLFLPEKKFEYLFMPLYSFGSQNLAGGGRLSYSIYPLSNYFSRINFSVGGQTYAYNTYSYADVSHVLNYRKVSSSVTFSLINRKENVDDFNDITLRNIWTETEEMKFPLQSDGTRRTTLSPVNRMFNFIYYTLGNVKTFNPYSFQLTLGSSNQFVLSSIEYNQTISYSKQGKGLDIRVYGGFTGDIQDENKPVSNPVDYNLHMSGIAPSNTFQQDYLFDEVLLGRSEVEGILSQQFAVKQGGFKTPSPHAVSNVWLLALNLKTAFPGILPVKFFADIGTYDQKNVSEESKTNLMFDYGFELTLIPKIFSVYFPIGYSKDIKEIYEFNSRFEKYGNRIRFELNIARLNPFELRRHLSFIL
jgi:hypothetical protein